MKKVFIILIATLLSVSANAQALDDIMEHEITEGKIIATMILEKEEAIKEMESILQSMVSLQVKIGEAGNSNGRVSALGQYITVISNTINDLRDISAEETTRIQAALGEARTMRDSAQALGQ